MYSITELQLNDLFSMAEDLYTGTINSIEECEILSKEMYNTLQTIKSQALTETK